MARFPAIRRAPYFGKNGGTSLDRGNTGNRENATVLYDDSI